MSWTRLYKLPTFPYLSAGLKKDIEKLAADVDDILLNRAKIDKSRAEMKEGALTEINFFNVMTFAPDVRAIVAQCLQNELKLRERFAQLDEAIRREAGPAHTNAGAVYEETKAEVRAQLTTIGYPPAPLNGEPDSVPPGFVARHPSVAAANREVSDMFQRINFREWGRENADAAELVATQLRTVLSAA